MLRCVHCLTFRCQCCVRDADDPEDVLKTVHDKHDVHTFVDFPQFEGGWDDYEEPDRCHLCPCRATAKCLCGAFRCLACQNPVLREKVLCIQESEHTPDYFYVRDSQSLSNIEKVEWIKLFKQEHEQQFALDAPDANGEQAWVPTGVRWSTAECSLCEFVKAYALLFGPLAPIVDRKAHNQKKACLDLYALFDPTFTIRRECQLPIDELREFERLWDPLALPRCDWCWQPFSGASCGSGAQVFCSHLCKMNDSPPVAGGRCPGCGGPDMRVVGGLHALCRTCGFFADVYDRHGYDAHGHLDQSLVRFVPHPPFLPWDGRLVPEGTPAPAFTKVAKPLKKPRRACV